jgi:hypothetical protein
MDVILPIAIVVGLFILIVAFNGFLDAGEKIGYAQYLVKRNKP